MSYPPQKYPQNLYAVPKKRHRVYRSNQHNYTVLAHLLISTAQQVIIYYLTLGQPTMRAKWKLPFVHLGTHALPVQQVVHTK